MISSNNLQVIYKQVADCYRRTFGDKVWQIFLYGSYARGDGTDDSDIDIAGIVHGERIDLQEKIKEVWDFSNEIGYEYDVIISPTIIPFVEFQDYMQVLPYYKNIIKEGIVIG